MSTHASDPRTQGEEALHGRGAGPGGLSRLRKSELRSQNLDDLYRDIKENWNKDPKSAVDN